jgi:8-oxo-dGTP pyrophosphatase MutT (NUDIX family)
MIKIEIQPKDSKKTAKAIITNKNGQLLLLRRSDHLEKFANELDLPGGHVQVGESLVGGLLREVLEETGLQVIEAVLVKIDAGRHFYRCKTNNFSIKLSDEHSEYLFRYVRELDVNNKFEKIAKEILTNEQRPA